jgi:hypothetical protein
MIKKNCPFVNIIMKMANAKKEKVAFINMSSLNSIMAQIITQI